MLVVVVLPPVAVRVKVSLPYAWTTPGPANCPLAIRLPAGNVWPSARAYA